MNNGPPIYIYCLSKAGISLGKKLKGLGGDPLYLIPWREVAAVVSHPCKKAYTHTTANAILHGKIVEEIQALSPVMPMRFPSFLEGKKDVREFLKKYYDVLEGHLQRVEGKCEISIGLISPLPKKTLKQTAHITSCHEQHLLQSHRLYEWEKGLYKRLEDMVEILSDSLRPHWEERHIEYQDDSPLISLYFLVKKDRLGAFFKAHDELKKTHTELRLLLSGPWPPYNFVPPGLKRPKIPTIP